MMRSNKLVIAALASLGLSLGLLSLGCSGEAQAHHQRADKAYSYLSYKVDAALDQVDADDAQREKVHAVKDRLYEDVAALRETGKETRRTAFEELKKEAPDAKKLHAMVDERMDEWREVMHNGVDAVLEVHGTLTPEQRDELAAMIEEKMARYERHE